MENKKTKFTVRCQSGTGLTTRVIVASHFEVEDGLVYFMADDADWDYICSLANLVDIEGEVVDVNAVLT